MLFSLEINNLGKIAGAPIVVGGLTVLAGPNATGKTFFSKALYSVFDAMNANHALVQIQTRTQPLEGILELLEMLGFVKNPALDSVKAQVERLESVYARLSSRGDEIAAVEGARQDLAAVTGEIVRAYGEARPAIEEFAKSGKPNVRKIFPKGMDLEIELLSELTTRSSEDIVLAGFRQALRQNLTGNFQISGLEDLQGNPENAAFLKIDGVGDIVIEVGRLQSNIRPAGLAQLQEFSRVIYLESPIHWKLRGALKGYTPRFRHRGRSLNVPKHFIDLDAALNDEYSGEVAFPELFRRLTEEILRGKIVIAESGELMFAESGQTRPFPLPMTATGMVNLGVLALLIERKIIDKGAFLFIDEPEANLHPKWQVEMIRALFELAQGGVHVVIATHSPDIMERLSALVKKNPGSEEMVALNHFSPEGVKNGGKGFNEKMDDIQRELTDSFSNSYMENVS